MKVSASKCTCSVGTVKAKFELLSCDISNIPYGSHSGSNSFLQLRDVS